MKQLLIAAITVVASLWGAGQSATVPMVTDSDPLFVTRDVAGSKDRHPVPNGFGTEELTPSFGRVGFALTPGDRLFDESPDAGFPTSRILTFGGGVFVGLDHIVDETELILQVLGGSIEFDFLDTGEDGAGVVGYGVIPLPAAAYLFGAAAAAFAWRHRRPAPGRFRGLKNGWSSAV